MTRVANEAVRVAEGRAAVARRRLDDRWQFMALVAGLFLGSAGTCVTMLAVDDPFAPDPEAAARERDLGDQVLRLKIRADTAAARADAAESHSLRVTADLADLWVLSARLALANADLWHELHKPAGPFAEVGPGDLIPVPAVPFPVAPEGP
ncbi:hypothetical protein [Gemmata sp.]|uniref:hypothetical protein n=1 Tax=Gemmata sp. TaxID=1914242 RepID=UPI003F72D111